MSKVFEFEYGWDSPSEKRPNDNISGPSSDGYVEIGGKVYEASNNLTPAQQKALQADVDAVVEKSRSFVINGKTYYYSR